MIRAEQASPEADEPALASLQQFADIVAQAPMAISITDLNATILYTNAEFGRITGYGEDEVYGCNHSVLSYQTTPRESYAELWQQLAEEQSWQGRLVNRKKNGERYLAEVTISPMRNEQGEVTHYMGLHRDVTDIHSAHMRLQNQNNLVHGVLNAAPVAIALLDADGNIVLDNLAYKALSTDLGTEPAEQALAVLQQQLGGNAAEQLLTRNFAEGHAISLDIKGKKERRWFSCRISSLPMGDEGIDGYFTPTVNAYLILSISEHTREKRQLEKQRISELQRMTSESEMRHAMQETLHAAIHQMQGPINMIEAALSMFCLQNGRCPGLDAMENALKQGADSVEQLKNALPDRSQEALQPVNLNQLIHEISAMTTERLLTRSIPLHLCLTGALPAFTGQPSRLRVALKQLLDNAIEAIDSGKCAQREIQIHSKLQDDAIVLVVEDSGPGVPKKQKLKIFQPFFSTKPVNTEGCRGIGLTIVQQVISEHCGTIEFKSSPLGGSCVVLTLPR